MNHEIRFQFEGKRYTAPGAFYEVECVRLPDGRFVRAGGFFETLPPQPTGLHVVTETPNGFVVARAAE